MRTLALLLMAVFVVPALADDVPKNDSRKDEKSAATTKSVEGSPSAGEVSPLRVPLSDAADLVFQQPKHFRFRITRDPDDGFRPALAFNAFGPMFKTQGLKVFVLENGQKAEFQTLAQLEERVKRMGGRYAQDSVEQEVKVQPLKMTAKDDFGCYATLTDAGLQAKKELLPGEFRCITLGFARVGETLLQIRMYSNSTDDADFKGAIRMIEGISVGKAEAPRAPKRDETPPPAKS